jgi:hypothetical protein
MEMVWEKFTKIIIFHQGRHKGGLLGTVVPGPAHTYISKIFWRFRNIKKGVLELPGPVQAVYNDSVRPLSNYTLFNSKGFQLLK